MVPLVVKFLKLVFNLLHPFVAGLICILQVTIDTGAVGGGGGAFQGRRSESPLLWALLVWVIAITAAVVVLYVAILTAKKRQERKHSQNTARSTHCRTSWINTMKVHMQFPMG